MTPPLLVWNYLLNSAGNILQNILQNISRSKKNVKYFVQTRAPKNARPLQGWGLP